MKTTLLLVRHGESLGNRDERFLGHTDLGLSELGLRQAEALAAALAGRHLDAVYSSDLMRTRQTVAPTAEDHGLPVIPRRDLREICAGKWENQRFDDLITNWPNERHIWKTDIGHAHPPGGESVAALYERVFTAISEIAAAHPGKTVLVGTHATPVRAITARLSGLGLEGMASLAWAPNASITTVVFEDGEPTLLEAAKADHLAGILNDVPKKI